MSKVMTGLLPQRSRYSRGLVRVAKVVIIGERNPPLWQNCRPVTMAVNCFRYMSCFQFCERLAQIQHHRELARLFVLHLQDGQVTLARVNFVLSPEVISEATGIPNVGEVWPKRKMLDYVYFEPYVRPAFMSHLSSIFPLRFLRGEYAPIMRLIMHYFTCEGRFSQVFSYHIRLLMHFTRVRMMNIPVFFF